MTKSTHTPGPWKVEHHGKAAYVSIYKPLGLPRETGWAEFSVQPYSHTDEATANARLIAAAPDLLAALQALYENCAMPHKYWGEGSNQKEADAAIAAGLAAIAKATGGQS